MKVTAAKILSVGAILFMGLLTSCSRQIPGPVSPPRDFDTPPTPTNLQIAIGDRTANLSWSISDTTGVSFYRVYMSDSTGANYELLGEIAQQSYTSASLQNGRLYYFKVSAVNYQRFEGYSSIAVSAMPNLYAVIINNGEAFTNDRDITLSLVASSGTRYMQVSDDSLFSNSNWENYVLTRSWEMPPGDGPFTIFARFRDPNDNITSGFYYDSITLDSRAFIDSLLFSPAGFPFSPGQSVHFVMFCNEVEGLCRVTIGQDLPPIPLFDDGGRGDAVPNDGIYETDFELGSSLDFEDAAVFGDFADRAGNVANQARSQFDISVRRPPDPILIIGVNGEFGRYDRLSLIWNSSQAGDFAQYRVYRSNAANVDSTDMLVRAIASAQTTSLTDTGLIQNTIYYYKIYVVDNTGLWTGSNEVSGATNPNSPPEPVILFPILAVPGTFDRLSLAWSASDDQDFLRYELYRSGDNIVDTSDILVLASTSQETFIDTGLAANTTYYYGVFTVDMAGNSSWSNIADGRTGIDEPPPAPILMPVFTEPDYYEDVPLSWTISYLSDFREFQAYVWREDLGRNDSLLTALISNQDSTEFVHHPPFPAGSDSANYWYIIHAYDNGGNSSGSNAVRVHLEDAVPGQVSGAAIADSEFITITWIPTEIPDFSNYRLLRDTLSTPDQAAVIFLSSDQGAGNFEDGNIVQGQTYYYWLDIYDRRNHSSRSFLGSARW